MSVCQIISLAVLKKRSRTDASFLTQRFVSRVNSHSFLCRPLTHNKADSQAHQQPLHTKLWFSGCAESLPSGQQTVWAWRSWDSHLADESTSTLCCESEGGGGFWSASLPLSLSFFLFLPPSLLPCLSVPSSTSPSHTLLLFYTGMTGNTMVHCRLPLVLYGGLPCHLCPPAPAGQWRLIAETFSVREGGAGGDTVHKWQHSKLLYLELSSGSNASLSSEHRCPSPAALQQIHN